MKEKLLFLTNRYPYPPHKGDTIRVYGILKYLSQIYDIILVSFSETIITKEKQQPLSEMVSQQIVWHQPMGAKTTFWALLKSIVFNIPISSAFYSNQQRNRILDDLIKKQSIKKMYVFSLALMDLVPKSFNHIYLDLCDVEIFKWHDYAKMSFKPLSYLYHYETRKTWSFLNDKVKDIEVCLVISHHEERLLKRISAIKKPVIVLPNGIKSIEKLHFKPTQEVFTLTFIGVMSYKPNIEGIDWFVKYVWPLVQEKIPNARLMIIGQNPSDRIKKLCLRTNITVTGYVTDVSEYLYHSSLIIVPIKMAYGVQNKVLEALGFGKKLIVTPEAMRGIDWLDEGVHVVSRDVNQWLKSILELRCLSLSAEQLIERRLSFSERYRWENCLRPLKVLSTFK